MYADPSTSPLYSSVSFVSCYSRPASITSGFQECQQVCVDGFSMRCRHAVRKALVGFQRAVLQKLCRQRAGVGVRDDLIVLAMHHQDRDSDLLQVFGLVGLREGDDAVVMRFGAAHHALAPPVLDDWLRRLTGLVVIVERAGGDITVELRAVSGKSRLEIIEYFLWQTARIGRC